MKKLVISKTVMFIFIVLFIVFFKSIFGNENTLIGVTIIIAMLMFLERDLTVSPWWNLFWLLSINISQGLFGYVSSLNMWASIPLNFIAMFIVGYFFSFTLKKPLYIAFGLQYLFILTTPVTADALPIRLLALASGALIIIAVQLLLNKNKLIKTVNKHIATICDGLISILTKENNPDINASIEASIKAIRKIIYFRSVKGFYLTNEGRSRLKISVCLEKMYLLFNRENAEELTNEMNQTILSVLENIKAHISDDSVNSYSLEELIQIQQEQHSMYLQEIINTFDLLRAVLEENRRMDKIARNKVEQQIEISHSFKQSYIHLNNISRNSVRFTYAMRLAIMITIAAFISDYFALENGKWIIFTIFSVTQPYSEQANFRFSRRIMATLTGAALFLVLFSLFTDTTSRSFIIILVGYLNSYAVRYFTVVLTVTISALGTASLIGDPTILTLERILYVLFGIVIGMIANRFILPHSLKTGTNNLVNMYRETSKQLMDAIYTYFEDRSTAHTINNLFTVSSLIEDRILQNNDILELKQSDQFLDKQRKLNHAMYELFLRVQKNQLHDKTVQLIITEMDSLLRKNTGDFRVFKQHFAERTKNITNLEDRILLQDIMRVFEGFKEIASFDVRLTPRKA